MADLKRVDIAFDGGPALSVRITEDEYKGLRKALDAEQSGRWHELRTQDAEVSVDVSKVIYVRVDIEQHKVGF